MRFRLIFILAALVALTPLALAQRSSGGGRGATSTAGVPLTGPSASGPNRAGYFQDFMGGQATGVGLTNIGSPSGQANGLQNGAGNDFNAPGNWQQNSGTVNGTGVQAEFSASSGQAIPGLTAGVWYWERRLRINALPSTTAAAYEEGLTGSLGVAPPTTNVVGSFYLSSANSVPNDWYCRTPGGSIDTGISATTSFVRLSMYGDGTNLHFYINGTEISGCKVAQSGVYGGSGYSSSATVALSTTNVSKFIDYDSFYAVVSR